MQIGVPREIKDHEYRVGLTPYNVKVLKDASHEIIVETKAGEKLGFTDEMYVKYGAKIAPSAKEVYKCPMIIKIKEPQEAEYALLKEAQILFCFLHLAPDPKQTEALLKHKVIGIAYETITDGSNGLPLLIPMSEMAGRLSITMGCEYLQMKYAGAGVFLAGLPGVEKAKVTIIGAGTVGTEAARMAIGLGADVTIFDKNLTRLRQLDHLYGPLLKTRFANPIELEEQLYQSDLIIGAVLIPGGKAPKIITKKMVSKMKKGTVIIDVAIDQGGCCETSHPTTHSNPIYLVDGVIHCCVTNMPSASAKTATLAINNALLPYALTIASLGDNKKLFDDPNIANGLNVYKGKVTNELIAKELGYKYFPIDTIFKD